ncbi:MAG TPA: hypothetical protein VFG11_01925 [Acidobacteriota bacterium]|nr:hypothetical protein [Acidobacteriota bacterium]
MRKAILVFALILIAGAGWTQAQQSQPTSPEDAMKAYKEAEKAYLDAAIEAKRANLRKNKREIIKQTAKFTEEQEKAFWPVYDKHEKELIKVNDLQYAMIKDYAANQANLTNEKALELASRQLDFQAKRIELRKSYMEDLKKVLPGTVVGRLMQLENRTDLMIDMEVASNVPLMQ